MPEVTTQDGELCPEGIVGPDGNVVQPPEDDELPWQSTTEPRIAQPTRDGVGTPVHPL